MKKQLITMALAATMALTPLTVKAEESTGIGRAIAYTDLVPDPDRKSTANTDERLDFLKVIINTTPNSLSAFYGKDAPTEYINQVIYETLLQRTGIDEYEGRLAKDWHYEDDETSVVFELYDGIYDWNGNPVKASDIVFSYEGIANSGRAENFTFYDHAEVVDDLTVKIVLKEKISDLVSFASMFSDVYIVSEASYDEATAPTNPVGTGSYKVKEFVTDAYIVLEANDDYWQKDDIKPWAVQNVQEIRIDFINDSSQALIAFTSGETVSLDVGPMDLLDFQEGQYSDRFTLTHRYSTDAFGLAANLHESSVMSDENLRMAVWYALSTEDFVYAAGEGSFMPCTTLVSPAVLDYDPDWDNIDSYIKEQNLELAKEYLEKSNYNGEKVRIMTKQFPLELNSIAQVTEQVLTSIGINCEINQYEHAVMMDQMQDPTTFDLYTCSGRNTFNSIAIINNILDVKRGAVPGYSTNFCSDEKMQELMDAANNRETYGSESTKAVMEYALEHGYYYSMIYGSQFAAYADNVAQIYQTVAGEKVYNAFEYYLD